MAAESLKLGLHNRLRLVLRHAPGYHSVSSLEHDSSAEIELNEQPLSPLGRGVLIGLAVFLVAGFGLSRYLKPDPNGYGTHQQLGLPECTIRALFNGPCPGCGMTTSFAHFVRGEFRASAQANPAGLWMAAGCVVLIPWCGFSAYRGRLWGVDDPWPAAAVLTASWGGTSLLVWAWRWWL